MKTSDDRRMRIIEGLLAKAAHENTPEAERISCQEQADALMIQYQIDRAMLNMDADKKGNVAREPIVREYDRVRVIQEGSTSASRRDFEEHRIEGVIQGIRRNVFHHAGARTSSRYKRGENGQLGKHVDVAVGFEEDLVFAEMLWLSVFRTILTEMFPGWSDGRSFDENVYLLKKAGYSWPQVREIGLRHDARDSRGPLTEKNAGSKLRTAFKRHAEKLGEEVPKGRAQPASPHLWRGSFVDSFSATLSQRMTAMKHGREKYFDKTNLPALQNDADLVTQKYYEEFPDANPANWPEPEPAKPGKKIRVRKVRLREADPSAWAAGHKSASRVSLNNSDSFARKEQIE